MVRGNVEVEKVFYKGDTDDFLVFVEDTKTVQQWKNDRSIPLAQVVRAMQVFVTHQQGAQGIYDEASRASLESEFGTHNVDSVITTILEKGSAQDMKTPSRVLQENS
ncbi:Ribosome maturation protein SBDS [Ascosphaera apis ARSEF 7405]|uniref:Ribosome maturation protein SBDS n=1 Tax=Ascosphaera apis ARSEF 7405 TaxID=392613 RepID=A0A167WBE8_9EURO|nr:Ribosome maturation protein SBDS [Ascosphaera apis ARSEF 7405]